MTDSLKKDETQLEKQTDAADEQGSSAEGQSAVEKVHVLDEETGETVEFSIDDSEEKKRKNADASDINEVNVRATVSSQDYYMAHVNHIFYRRGIVKAAFVFALIIVLDLLVRYFVPGMVISKTYYLLVILTALFVSIGLPMLLKSQIGKAYDKNVFYSKFMRYSINNKCVAVASKSRGKKIPWDKFKYIKQTDDFFLFVIDGTHAVVIPIRVLSGNEIQAIRGLILKNTADNKKIKVKLP